MTPLAAWCLARKMSMRLSCDLACARKIINLFIINANDSNCKETQTFPYCTGSTPHNASREIISILSLEISAAVLHYHGRNDDTHN